MPKPIIEEKTFKVSVTVRLHTTVCFDKMRRATPITAEDALSNFYGYGLDAFLDKGEYGYDISDIEVKEII